MPLTLLECLEQGIQTSKQLQQQTGLSQAGVSRQLQALGTRVVRLGSGPATRYALARDAFGIGNQLPVLAVDDYGNDTVITIIRPLFGGGYFVEAQTGCSRLLLGCNGDGLYDGLPWFIEDMRPQGFLGRQVAAALHQKNAANFPSDPRYWNDEQLGRYLVGNGDDLSGNLKFGPAAYSRLQRVPQAVNRADYPALAEQVLSGSLPGSSAGGEQPKFTAYSTERNAHVIVKFSPAGDEPIAQRWRDILLSEYHALQVLAEYRFPVAQVQLLAQGERLFLESERFDRFGRFGRSAMFSLQVIDAEFCGTGGSWTQVAQALCQQQRLSPQHLADIQVIAAFGRLINNSDMHLGNLSLGINGDLFQLLPIYDMCAMGFAPRGGEVLPYQFTAPGIKQLGLDKDALAGVLVMAQTFWQNLAADARISQELREFITNRTHELFSS